MLKHGLPCAAIQRVSDHDAADSFIIQFDYNVDKTYRLIPRISSSFYVYITELMHDKSGFNFLIQNRLSQ